MRMTIGAALLLITTAVFAQRVPLGGGVPGIVGGKHDRREAQKEESEPDTLAAAGKRDGDEQLTCEQLHTEFQSTMQNLQPQGAGQAASAEDSAAKMAEIQQRMQEMQNNRPGIAKGIAQSMNPFGAKKRAERQQAEAEAQAAEIQRMLPAGAPAGTAGPSGVPGFSMEAMARTQRVSELGKQKNCDWANAIPPGEGPETAAPRPSKTR